MPRVVGVDIPNDKQVVFSLTYIYGIGLPTAKKILKTIGIKETIRAKDLGEDELSRLGVEIEKNYGALALLKDMTIILRGEIEGTKKFSLEPIHCDLTPVHRQIERKVASMIPQYQVRSNRKINSEQLVQILKQYWIGDS